MPLYQFDSDAETEKRRRIAQIQDDFRTLVYEIAERLEIGNAGQLAPRDILAEAIVRGDEVACYIAQRWGFIPKPERKEEDDED